MLPDRAFFTLAALAAVVMIALAAVYPQGVGARSPKPFGHATAAEVAAHAAKTGHAPAPTAVKAKLKGVL